MKPQFHKEGEDWVCQFDSSKFNWEWATGKTKAEAYKNLVSCLKETYGELKGEKLGKHLEQVKENLKKFLKNEMKCPKCKKQMVCEGVSTSYQDWFCPICGYSKRVKKENKK